MGQSSESPSPLAIQLIGQCRREIAAAWEQIEAGRLILEHSRWLLTRWAKQALVAQQVALPRLAMGGTFEVVQEEPRQRLRRKRRDATQGRLPSTLTAAKAAFTHRPAGHIPRRSGSG